MSKSKAETRQLYLKSLGHHINNYRVEPMFVIEVANSFHPLFLRKPVVKVSHRLQQGCVCDIIDLSPAGEVCVTDQ